MLMTCGSQLVAASALVGYRLTPDMTLATLPRGLQMPANTLTSIPASMLMQRIGRRHRTTEESQPLAASGAVHRQSR